MKTRKPNRQARSAKVTSSEGARSTETQYAERRDREESEHYDYYLVNVNSLFNDKQNHSVFVFSYNV